MVDSRWLFTGLVALVGVQRLVELRLAERNRCELLARGGFEVGKTHYRWMVLLHATFLSAAPLEVWSLDRPLLPVLALAMTALLVAAMTLRYWAIMTLGSRWTTRVVVLPGAPRIETGPFRFLRHPNYLAVVTEMVALPMVHTAWLTALTYSLLNAALLRTRIRVEEDALREAASAC
jgi:methyltransferase